ncbi:hypothetical protein Dsin_012304 [Dipteronia sinensis]|uniref:Uncharacterized protein n=1 Tax=Dipteronia sinensis TaxID=43782 RepID=A0AAE0E822_9ROSI|nr:hypothetical protein Dsin_012304 [Dipteronia sinensis]
MAILKDLRLVMDTGLVPATLKSDALSTVNAIRLKVVPSTEPPSKHQVTNPNRRQLDPPPDALPLADQSGAAAIIISDTVGELVRLKFIFCLCCNWREFLEAIFVAFTEKIDKNKNTSKQTSCFGKTYEEVSRTTKVMPGILAMQLRDII